MAQICEHRNYAIFGLYLTINPVEPVYESFCSTSDVIWCIGDLTECPRYAWCAVEKLKMASKVAKFCRE